MQEIAVFIQIFALLSSLSTLGVTTVLLAWRFRTYIAYAVPLLAASLFSLVLSVLSMRMPVTVAIADATGALRYTTRVDPYGIGLLSLLLALTAVVINGIMIIWPYIERHLPW